jgi:hypothetical protein
MPPLVPVALIAALAVPSAQAASPMRGQLLYGNFCHHCHMTEIHFRVHRRVGTWGELIRMISVWQEEMALGWRAEEITDVASYLNRIYYGFSVGGIE